MHGYAAGKNNPINNFFGEGNYAGSKYFRVYYIVD